MRFFNILFVVSIFISSFSVIAEDGHDHEGSHAHEEEHSEHSEKKPNEKEHQDHDKHDEEEGHSHDEHKEHKEHGGTEAEEAHAHEDEHDHDEHSGHDDHAEEAFGENKAIVEVMNEGDKFRLHTESIKFLNLEFASVTYRKETEYTVPSSALVRFQNHTGIYRVIGSDVFEMLHLDVLSEKEGLAIVKSKNLKPKDRVVVSKLGNLRAAQLQASGQGGQGHAH